MGPTRTDPPEPFCENKPFQQNLSKRSPARLKLPYEAPKQTLGEASFVKHGSVTFSILSPCSPHPGGSLSERRGMLRCHLDHLLHVPQQEAVLQGDRRISLHRQTEEKGRKRRKTR